MVLPSSNADHQPSELEAPWLRHLQHLLALNLGLGVMILVQTDQDHLLAEVIRALSPSHPNLHVVTEVATLQAVPDDALIILSPNLEAAQWLNLQRPLFAQKRWKVVLWMSPADAIGLARSAPDFFDWISHRIEVPSPVSDGQDQAEVEVAGERAGPLLAMAPASPLEPTSETEHLSVLTIHASVDLEAAREFHQQLGPLVRSGQLKWLSDQTIAPGQNWKGEIERMVAGADVIVVLISPGLLASDWSYKRLTELLVEPGEFKADIIPIVLRPTSLDRTPWAKLQALPRGGKPISSFDPREDGWSDVVQWFERLVRLRLPG